MLAVPPALLDTLNLATGSTVRMVADSGRLIIEVQQQRPRYTMDELLAASDYSQPQPPEDREWIDSSTVGPSGSIVVIIKI